MPTHSRRGFNAIVERKPSMLGQRELDQLTECAPVPDLCGSLQNHTEQLNLRLPHNPNIHAAVLGAWIMLGAKAVLAYGDIHEVRMLSTARLNIRGHHFRKLH